MYQKIKNLIIQIFQQKKVLAAIVIAVLVFVVIILKGNTDSKESSAVAELRTIVDQVTLSGRTESIRAVELGFADTGRISNVFVQEGDRVKAGQVLATLETGDLYVQDIDAVTQEQNSLVASTYRKLLSTNLAAIPAGFTTDVISPTISGLYSGPEGAYELRVYASAANTGRSFEISGIENKITQTVILDTKIPLGTKGLFIEFSEVPHIGTWTVSIPNKQSAEYPSLLSEYESALATKKRVINDAMMSNQSVVARINKRKIIAPFSGVIASVGIKAGESTTSLTSDDSSQGIRMISDNEYQIVLKVPEISIAKINEGQKVSINLDAYGKDTIFYGTVSSISPAETFIDGVPVYETKVVFDEKDNRIRSGMTAIATIIAESKENVVAIPVSFIYEESGENIVYVQHEDTLEKRVVQVGLRGSDSYQEITAGLSAGEKVVAQQ